MYNNVMALGDKLHEIDKIMDWNIFRPILSESYKNKIKKCGRPSNDVIISLRL
jgi:IS5 family transposase